MITKSIIAAALAGCGYFVAASVGATEYSLWPKDFVPAAVGFYLDNAHTLNLGVRFKSSVAGNVVGIRYYKHPDFNNQQPRNSYNFGLLWAQDGRRLGAVYFNPANETESGWQEARFDQPIAISANTEYTAAYFLHTKDGYAATQFYFANGNTVNNGPLETIGSGVYEYVSLPNGPAFWYPYRTYRDNNYWVDLIFDDGTN